MQKISIIKRIGYAIAIACCLFMGTSFSLATDPFGQGDDVHCDDFTAPPTPLISGSRAIVDWHGASDCESGDIDGLWRIPNITSNGYWEKVTVQFECDGVGNYGQQISVGVGSVGFEWEDDLSASKTKWFSPWVHRGSLGVDFTKYSYPASACEGFEISVKVYYKFGSPPSSGGGCEEDDDDSCDDG